MYFFSFNLLNTFQVYQTKTRKKKPSKGHSLQNAGRGQDFLLYPWLLSKDNELKDIAFDVPRMYLANLKWKFYWALRSGGRLLQFLLLESGYENSIIICCRTSLKRICHRVYISQFCC